MHHDDNVNQNVYWSKDNQTETNIITHNRIINKVCKTENVVAAY